MVVKANGREVNLEFVKATLILASSSDFKQRYITCPRSLQNIEGGEELIVD